VAARTNASSTPLISQYREIGTSPSALSTGSWPDAWDPSQARSTRPSSTSTAAIAAMSHASRPGRTCRRSSPHGSRWRGTARPSTGIYVIGNTGIDFRPGNFATTQVMQVSRYGNLGIVGFVGGVAANAPTITAITDTESTSWSTAFTSVVNDSRVGMLYGPNATANPSSLMTLTLNISTGDFTAQCLDVSGAAVSPLGAFGTNTGNQSVAGDNSCISITPTASNGLVYCEMGVAFNTNVGLTAPAAGYFISSTFDNQDLDGPSTPDENNAWAIWYNPNTSAQTFTFHMRSPSEANGNWAAGIAEFKAA
jgi:hypothetical protein